MIAIYMKKVICNIKAAGKKREKTSLYDEGDVPGEFNSFIDRNYI
jgi:hypothetical protein